MAFKCIRSVFGGKKLVKKVTDNEIVATLRKEVMQVSLYSQVFKVADSEFEVKLN